MDELQLEEQQKTTQQSQDQAPYDPTAAARFPGGYTPVGEGVDNTTVEQVSPINIGEVEVTAGIDLSNPALESLVSSSGEVFPQSISLKEAYNAFGIPITPVNTNGINLSNIDIPTFSGDIVGDISIPSNPEQQSPPVSEQPITPTPEVPKQPITPDIPTPPVVDPPAPPEPPVLPPDPPVDPPVDPEEPEDPEDPEDPEPEDPEDPEDPDPEDPEDPDPEDPEDPDPEDPEDPDPDGGGGNPGNDKDVGNSPWDGETGASDNPGKGNHQDGQDPEPNQPPGDSKNDGPNGNQNSPSENDHGNGGGGGKPESKGNNGWGNGDDDAPGNSLPHNNAENDQTPNGRTADLVDKFLEDHPSSKEIDATYNWKQDTDDYLDYPDDMPIEMIDHVDLSYIDHLDHSHDFGYHHPE